MPGGKSSRATLAKRRADVAQMFDGVSARYDLMNDLMTLGQAREWRFDVLDAVAPRAGDRVLDLAAGTGTSSVPFADAGAFVVACDMSLGMLQVGHRRQPQLSFIGGDALTLPFADDAFDAVTISFGLRNVTDTPAALKEMLRVTRPGGRLVICEFSTPVWAPLRAGYRLVLGGVIPAMAKLASSNASAYGYLGESILAWPDQTGIAAMVAEAGWRRVEYRNLTCGVVALHRGFAPDARSE